MRHTRKIFPAHAGEIANKLLGELQGGRLVARFVNSYVAEFDRDGLKVHPDRYRELLSTLTREVLLAMVSRVQSETPRYLSRRRPPLLRGPEAKTAELLRAELLAALARALRWTPGDTVEFQSDLALYAQLGADRPAPARQRERARKPSAAPGGPFVDRCALLLDPSMLDKARKAAGQLLLEVERLTDEILTSVLRGRRVR